MIIGVSLLVLILAGTGPVQGTVISGVKVSSLLKGWMEFWTGRVSLHNKWVQSKFLTELSWPLPFSARHYSKFCTMAGTYRHCIQAFVVKADL